MDICMNCKYYEVNNLTELGLCRKHGLSMHYSAVQECYEEKTNNDTDLLKQINKIIDQSNADYLKDFKEDIRSIARLLLGSIDGLEFNKRELDILSDLAAVSMKRMVDQEVENTKNVLLNPSLKKNSMKVLKSNNLDIGGGIHGL